MRDLILEATVSFLRGIVISAWDVIEDTTAWWFLSGLSSCIYHEGRELIENVPSCYDALQSAD